MIEQDRKRRQWNRRIHKGRNLRFCRHKTECKNQLVSKARRSREKNLFYKFCLHEGLCVAQTDDCEEAKIDLRLKK